MKKSQIVSQIVKRHWPKLILLWSAGLLSVGLAFILVWLSKLLIDIATGDSTNTTLAIAISGYFTVVFIRILISSASRWLTSTLSATMTKEIRGSLYNTLLYARWPELSRWKSGDLTSRFLQDIKEVSKLLVSQWPALATSLVQLVGALIFIYFIDSRITWAVLFILPIVFIFSRLYFRKMRTITHKVKKDESSLIAFFGEVVRAQLIVRVFNQQHKTLQKLETEENKLIDSIKKWVVYGTGSGFLLKIVFTGGYALALVWAVYQLHLGLITFGSVVAFLQLVSYIQAPTYNTVKLLPDIVSSLTAIDRLEELTRIPQEELNPIQLTQEVEAIEARGLQFSYPQRDEVLQGIDFRIDCGDLIALTGVTGTGKTTIFKILMGLEKPQEGIIELILKDGHRVYIDEKTRHAFAYVPQEVMLFSGTIKENLLLGKPDASSEDIHTALHLAEADYVHELPEGLNTILTEGNTNLSEGQAQRLSIARALLSNRPILLLDEATSAIDPETEKKLLNNIRDLSVRKGLTILFITHNPVVAEHCPRNLHLSHGQLLSK